MFIPVYNHVSILPSFLKTLSIVFDGGEGVGGSE